MVTGGARLVVTQPAEFTFHGVDPDVLRDSGVTARPGPTRFRGGLGVDVFPAAGFRGQPHSRAPQRSGMHLGGDSVGGVDEVQHVQGQQRAGPAGPAAPAGQTGHGVFFRLSTTGHRVGVGGGSSESGTVTTDSVWFMGVSLSWCSVLFTPRVSTETGGEVTR